MLTVSETLTCEILDQCDFATFDAETGPADDDTLRKLCPEPNNIPKHPGEFDPAAVKYGNTKDKDKRAEKLAEEQAKHAAAVKDFDATVAKAKADHFEKFKSDAALHAEYGRVVAIGVDPCPIMGKGPGIIACDSANPLADEVSGLKLFWQWVAKNLQDGRPMIGFNIHGFDLPFLCRRSWCLGVPIPLGVRKGRFWNEHFIDLMRVWNFDVNNQYVSLNIVAAALGLGKKIEEVDGVKVDGASFYKLWRENRKVAEIYLIQDLRLPSLIARKLGVV